MTIFDGLILGILQGITEFIPVSSSGHLVVAQHFLGIEHSSIFDAMVNLGTFLALLIYFRKRIWAILLSIFKDHDLRLARNIIISAIPVGFLGFFFADFFEQAMLQNSVVVAIMLVIVGLFMIFVDKLPKLSVLKSIEQINPKRAIAIGVAQAVALIPGTSRSGSTMVAGRIMGLSYAQAAEYSFLLSIPVMAGVVAKGLLTSEGQTFITNNLGVWLVSNAAAFVCGLFAVGFMMRFLAKGNFKVFGYYRLGLAAVIAIMLVVVR